MLKGRNRKKMAKNHIPSNLMRFIVEKAAGQKIYFYELYDQNNKKPKGYIDASTSRIEEGLKISSPLIKIEDIDLVVPAIRKIVPLVDNDTKFINLKLSMHRKALINKLLKAGFELKNEALFMRIKFDEEKTNEENGK